MHSISYSYSRRGSATWSDGFCPCVTAPGNAAGWGQSGWKAAQRKRTWSAGSMAEHEPAVPWWPSWL